MDEDQFVMAVQRWAGLDADGAADAIADPLGDGRDGARRAASAAITTLADAAAPGDVEDVLAELPPELGELVRREDQLPAGRGPGPAAPLGPLPPSSGPGSPWSPVWLRVPGVTPGPDVAWRDERLSET
jgi:hypothetical protein